jgi:VWFA-related protein
MASARSLILSAMVAGLTLALQAQQQAPPPAKRPVFRAGAHFVSVDAYPTRDGRIVEGLTKDDFDIFEDGKRQQVDTLEWVAANAPLPDDDRPTYLSSREALELAADSKYRVFIFVLDREALELFGWPAMRDALHGFFETHITPRDLIDLITTDGSWRDLALGRRVSAIEADIDNPEWINPKPPEQTIATASCGFDMLRPRLRADQTYSMLEGLVSLLGNVRQDRTSIVFISNGLLRVPASHSTPPRRMTLPPKMGIVNGRIQRIPRDTDARDTYCQNEAYRLSDMDFDRRYGDLTRAARAANIAFYPITVSIPIPNPVQRALAENGQQMLARLGDPAGYFRSDTMVPLAKDTDGVALYADGDLRSGFNRIVEDVGPHYLLGYYTTNTKWDGKLRSIAVRLKPKGDQIRARKQYRAPTKEEIESLSGPKAAVIGARPAAVASALTGLSAIRPSAQFFTYGAVSGTAMTVMIEVPSEAVDAGRWSNGATLEVIADGPTGETVGMAHGRLAPNGRAMLKVPLDGREQPSKLLVRVRAEGEAITESVAVGLSPSKLAGDPLVYRSGPRGLAIPVAVFQFTREERVKFDWPLLAKIDRYEARLLDQFGHPLSTKIGVQHQDAAGVGHLVTEISLAPLGRGDYVVDLGVESSGVVDHKLTAFRVR